MDTVRLRPEDTRADPAGTERRKELFVLEQTID